MFTRESANALLPELRPRLEQLRDAQAALGTARARARSNGGPAPHADGAERTIAGILDWLRHHGVLLKDPARGLVDFPSLRDGRVVLLCWQLGEPAVDHWHEVADGFAGRRPL